METNEQVHWRIYGRRDSALVAPSALFTRTKQEPVLDEGTEKPKEFTSLEEAVAARDHLNASKPRDVDRFVIYRYTPGSTRVEELDEPVPDRRTDGPVSS